MSCQQFVHFPRQELHKSKVVPWLGSASWDFQLWCPICLEKGDEET